MQKTTALVKLRIPAFATILLVAIHFNSHFALAASSAATPAASKPAGASASTSATSSTSPKAAATPAPAVNPPTEDGFAEQPLDGVKMEALETYRNPRASQFQFGISLWPLNAYYNGLSLDFGYARYFNKTYSWEVIRASYVYTIDKGLSSELADKYSVNPSKIERLNFVFSSTMQYVLAYGKYIYFKEHVRYFRSNLIAGPAIVLTNARTTVGVQLGIGIETYANDLFSWKAEIRDTVAAGGDNINNLAFSVGTSYAF